MFKFILLTTLSLWFLQASAGLVDIEVGSHSPDIFLGPDTDKHWIYRDPSPTSPCGADYSVSSDGDAFVSFHFKGVAISVRLIRYVFGARVAIELDGVRETIVDTYSKDVDCLTPVFQKTNLTYGVHTINITDVTRLPKYWYNFKSFTYTTYEEDIPTISSSDNTAKIILPDADKPKRKSNAGPIAGGVVGGVLGLIIVVALARCALRRRTEDSEEPKDEAEKGTAAISS